MCVTVCVRERVLLLRESRGHGVGHHGLWGLLRGRLWGEGERRMSHTILASRLVPAKLLGLEVLVLEGGHRVAGATIAVSLSVVAVAIAVVTTVATALVVAVGPAIATILCLWSTTVAPIIIPIPEVTKIPSPPRIPIAAVVLIASSAPTGATCGDKTTQRQLRIDTEKTDRTSAEGTTVRTLSNNKLTSYHYYYWLLCQLAYTHLLCLPPSGGAWG